jgi:DNA-binding XRE family transcriptional regulator
MEENEKYLREVSNRISKIIEELNIPKVQMANELNIKKQSFYALEQGNRKLQIEEIKILMNKFNISPFWLISGYGKMFTEENPKQVKLTSLVVDYLDYGGEVEMVINEILKKIIKKLFSTKKLLKIIPVPNSIHGDHIPYALMQIIVNSCFADTEENAKNYFRDQIESFDKVGGPSKSGVKKDLYHMLEKISKKDCFYLLTHKKIAAKQLLVRISPFNKKCNDLFIKKDRELHKMIDNLP